METPGFVYKDQSGKLTGVCVDIMNDFLQYVRQNHGINLNARFLGNGSSFSAMYNGVRNGKNGVFGLGNITVTEARKSEILFSPIIYHQLCDFGNTQQWCQLWGSMDEVSSKI